MFSHTFVPLRTASPFNSISPFPRGMLEILTPPLRSPTQLRSNPASHERRYRLGAARFVSLGARAPVGGAHRCSGVLCGRGLVLAVAARRRLRAFLRDGKRRSVSYPEEQCAGVRRAGCVPYLNCSPAYVDLFCRRFSLAA